MFFNILGFILIFFIAFWFWYPRKEKGIQVSTKKIQILVADGIYQPNRIEARVGQHIVLEFIRQDKTPCAEMVIFSDFNQSLKLPINEPTLIKLKPKNVGEFDFTCQMGMYRGKLIVREAN